jgi:hypothetical protein
MWSFSDTGELANLFEPLHAEAHYLWQAVFAQQRGMGVCLPV